MESKIEKVLQLTVKPGIHLFIGVENLEDFRKRKLEITNSRNEFVDITDRCTVKRDEIVSIEYFEKEVNQDEKSETAAAE